MKTAKTYLIIIMTAILFMACSNFEEGPHFSFRKPEARITGTWELQKILLNDMMCDSLYQKEADFQFIYNKNYTFEIKLKNDAQNSELLYNGHWSFNPDNNNLNYTLLNDSTISYNYRVTRLTNKEMWLVVDQEFKMRKATSIEKRYLKSN
ncbi:MAG: hypothetical protein GX879_00445 [Bacteroidales bacterium]|nr:hypothetical protein [Bacteroidales bacterium]